MRTLNPASQSRHGGMKRPLPALGLSLWVWLLLVLTDGVSSQYEDMEATPTPSIPSTTSHLCPRGPT